jgi:hypothetical protein
MFSLERAKKIYSFWRFFFNLLGTQNYYQGIDKGHWWKTRCGFKTAWKVAKKIWR